MSTPGSSPDRAPGPPGCSPGPSSRGAASDELFRAIVETVPVPLLVLDGEHRVLDVNPAWVRAFGGTEEERLGKAFTEVDEVLWSRPTLRAALDEVAGGGEEIRDRPLRLPGTGAEDRHFRVTLRAIRDPGGSRDRVLVTLEELTEHRRYERKLERYARELERSNRDLESFAHAASHDLQEPLRKLHTYTDRIVAGLDPALFDERQRRYLARMPEAVERMQRRIDDLLLYARLDSSGIERVPVSLDEVVREVRAELEMVIRESGARIQVDPLPVIHGDASQLRLLFQNLISNAIKFSGEGNAPVIRIHPVGVELEDPSRLEVVVEDEGIGFSPEYAERIFLPFHRLHGRDRYEGSGVGLAICRRVVEAHGGSIRADSNPDRGATFTLTFPQPNDPQPQQPGEPP